MSYAFNPYEVVLCPLPYMYTLLYINMHTYTQKKQNTRISFSYIKAIKWTIIMQICI